MSTKLAPLGQIQLTLEPRLLKGHIAKASLTAKLNSPATCSLLITIKAEDTQSMTLASITTKISVEIDNKVVFKGELVSLSSGNRDEVELVFSDRLYKTQRLFPNTFLKDVTLADGIRELLSGLSVPVQFIGDFSEKLSAFHVSGKSVLQQIQELAETYGFFFVCHQTKQSVIFVKMGGVVDSQSVPADLLDSYELRQTHTGYFKKVTLEYFDSESMGPKAANVPTEALYSEVASWMGHSTFDTKKRWHFCTGELESHVRDTLHFKEGVALLRGRLSRQVMEQERLTGVSHRFFPQPGEKISLSKTRVPKIQDGDYLVESVTFTLDSASPRAQFSAIRP